MKITTIKHRDGTAFHVWTLNEREKGLIRARIKKLNKYIQSQMQIKKADRDKREIQSALTSIEALNEWL